MGRGRKEREKAAADNQNVKKNTNFRLMLLKSHCSGAFDQK